MTDSTERYGGKPYAWGGKVYIIAPIGLGYVERTLQQIKAITAGTMSEEEIKATMKQLVFRSLRRNYPDMTEEFINDEILELSNLQEIYRLALEASGIKLGKADAESPPTSTS